MSKRNFGKCMAIGLAVAAAVAMPLSASAQGWHGGGYRGGGYGYHGGGYYHGGYYRGGYWSGGRWIAGAIVAGAVAGVVGSALAPAPYYYGPQPVVYAQPTVVYQTAPAPVVVYSNDPYQTRYVRTDGY
jgi:hypothetical protein